MTCFALKHGVECLASSFTEELNNSITEKARLSTPIFASGRVKEGLRIE